MEGVFLMKQLEILTQPGLTLSSICFDICGCVYVCECVVCLPQFHGLWSSLLKFVQGKPDLLKELTLGSTCFNICVCVCVCTCECVICSPFQGFPFRLPKLCSHKGNLGSISFDNCVCLSANVHNVCMCG